MGNDENNDNKTRESKIEMEKCMFRFAEENDISLILYFIKELAKYEEMLDEVVATEELLKECVMYASFLKTK